MRIIIHQLTFTTNLIACLWFLFYLTGYVFCVRIRLSLLDILQRPVRSPSRLGAKDVLNCRSQNTEPGRNPICKKTHAKPLYPPG